MKFKEGVLVTGSEWMAVPNGSLGWNIKRENLNEDYDKRYKGGLLLTELLNRAQDAPRLHLDNFAVLVPIILRLMRKERKYKLFTHPHNPIVSAFLDRLGATTNPEDSDEGVPLRILTYEQLESALHMFQQHRARITKNNPETR